MKTLLISFLLFLATTVANVPLPTLYEYHYKEEKIFGLYWLSDGVQYKYRLEANVGNGWFEVAEWVNIPKGISMTGYTYYGSTQLMGIARVRVERIDNPPPTPRGLAKWKVLTPIRF
jgi:hypothetical protein